MDFKPYCYTYNLEAISCTTMAYHEAHNFEVIGFNSCSYLQTIKIVPTAFMSDAWH